MVTTRSGNVYVIKCSCVTKSTKNQCKLKGTFYENGKWYCHMHKSRSIEEKQDITSLDILASVATNNLYQNQMTNEATNVVDTFKETNIVNNKVTIKNSLRSRVGTIRYNVSNTLHGAFANRHTDNNHITNKSSCINLHGHNDSNNQCSYCDISFDVPGVCKSEDHIRSVVNNKRPSVWMIHNDHNKIECCNKCNTSKGKKDVCKWLDMKDMPGKEWKIPKLQHIVNNIPMLDDSQQLKMNNVHDWFMDTLDRLTTLVENVMSDDNIVIETNQDMSNIFSNNIHI